MALHDLHHMRHSWTRWNLNQQAAKNLMCKMEAEQFGDLTLVRGSRKQLKEVERLHAQLFREPMLNWLVWVYRFQAAKLISLAIDKNNVIVGYECFMFNECEIQDQIIHEVYIGVAEEYQGKGVATALRKYSLNTYNYGNLKGVSTVALTNDIKALRSAQKAGFAILKQSLKPSGHYLFKYLSLYH